MADKLKAPFEAYKVFDPDWKCRGFQYEIGKEYIFDGPISICSSGFHACLKLTDCFDYYGFDSINKVALVEIRGDFACHESDSKVVTDKIYIKKELSWHEVIGLVNIGHRNTGRRNSGNRNSGDRNSGNRNSGNRNSGDWNSGDWNSGNRNSGDWNSGDRNSGYRNSGDWNSGDWNSGDWNSGNMNSGNRNSGNRNSGNRNSGDWNSCDNSSGVFCSETPKILIFDRPSDLTLREWRATIAHGILSQYNPFNWIVSSNMTDQEKHDHPEHETTGGFLRSARFVDFWRSLPAPDKEEIMSIPNFDQAKFKAITGVDIDEQ